MDAGVVIASYENVNNMYTARSDDVGTSINTTSTYMAKPKNTTYKWTLAQTSGTPPEKRRCHSAALQGTNLWIFGGYTGTTLSCNNDLHFLDLLSMTWSTPEIKGEKPTPRSYHSADFVKKKDVHYWWCSKPYLQYRST